MCKRIAKRNGQFEQRSGQKYYFNSLALPATLRSDMMINLVAETLKKLAAKPKIQNMDKLQMIEVFKTSISKDAQPSVHECLITKFPDLDVNIDTEDCDKVLRIVGKQVQNEQIIAAVRSLGFNCEMLED